MLSFLFHMLTLFTDKEFIFEKRRTGSGWYNPEYFEVKAKRPLNKYLQIGY